MNLSTQNEVFRWKPACLLHVSGNDAGAFLQGQFTNDLRGAGSGRAVYGLWLSVQGRVVADSFVIRGQRENEYWICSYHSPAALVRERLASHVVADDVVIADETARWAGITVFGSGAVGERTPGTAPGGIGGAGVLAFPGRRAAEAHVEYLAPIDAFEPPAHDAALAAARELGAAEVERRRISAGIPAVPADVGPHDLPNEGGLDRDAISYSKGCYLGQEIMSRLKSMGQIRRRLVRVRGRTSLPPALPAPLFVGSQQAGELRSAAADAGGGVIGLAMVSRRHVSVDATLSFGPEGAPTFVLLDPP